MADSNPVLITQLIVDQGRLPESYAEMLRHSDRIKDEVLAVELETDGVAEPQIEKI